jgi:hypothetical protein
MRRLLGAIGVLVLALPAAAAGALGRGPGDGTLVVDNANGVVNLAIRGGVIGRFDQGTIVVVDPVEGDGPAPVLNGCEFKIRLTTKKTECDSSGSEVRFRLIGGLFRVHIDAIGVDVSVVGRGSAELDGSGYTPQPGRYSLNGGPYRAVPKSPTQLTLGPFPAATLGAK